MTSAPCARKFAKLALQSAANTTWNTAKRVQQLANAVPMLAPQWLQNKALSAGAVMGVGKISSKPHIADTFIA
jgi:hypothetical protein